MSKNKIWYFEPNLLTFASDVLLSLGVQDMEPELCIRAPVFYRALGEKRYPPYVAFKSYIPMVTYAFHLL